MVDKPIGDVIRRYLSTLPALGIRPSRAVLFGSFARDEADEDSDIDLIVIAPEFDSSYTLETVESLWEARAGADNRIEPIPCGEREWEAETGRPILDIARQEGIVIAAE